MVTKSECEQDDDLISAVDFVVKAASIFEPAVGWNEAHSKEAIILLFGAVLNGLLRDKYKLVTPLTEEH